MPMIKTIANKFRLNYFIEPITVSTQNKSYNTNFAEFSQITYSSNFWYSFTVNNSITVFMVIL
jgi:hypothetical protein